MWYKKHCKPGQANDIFRIIGHARLHPINFILLSELVKSARTSKSRNSGISLAAVIARSYRLTRVTFNRKEYHRGALELIFINNICVFDASSATHLNISFVKNDNPEDFCTKLTLLISIKISSDIYLHVQEFLKDTRTLLL